MFFQNNKKEIKNILSRKKRGFTIMETLVAISLLLLAITGPMVFSQNGLRGAFNSRDQITAFYLSQDAIEFIKNRRDHNILQRVSSSNWLSGLDDCFVEVGVDGCSIDTTFSATGDVEQCLTGGSQIGCLGEDEDGSDDVPLKIDTDGSYGHTGDDSVFARTISIEEIVSGVEAKITVTIRWQSHESLGVRQIKVVEYIYNWGDAIGLLN